MWFDLEDYWEEGVGREMIQGVTSDSGWCSEVSEEGGARPPPSSSGILSLP